MTNNIEHVLIRGCIRVLLDNGYFLTVNNGAEEVIRTPTRDGRAVAKAIIDSDYVCAYHYIIAHKGDRKYWVRFIHGCGEFVINDFSTALSPLLGGQP